jgi:5'-phosphate synthase pdxT subunit
VDSFEAPLQVVGLGDAFPGVFIRAPLVEDAGGVEVLSQLDGHPVAVRQGRVMALAFHPELSGDDRLHRLFLELVASAHETAAGERRSA